MTDRAADVPLTGGNSNAPVRRGDRVLRFAGPWTPTIHRLLAHVRKQGIHWLPEPLGVDGDREVLSFLPGVVPDYPLPSWVWDDGVLDDAGRMLRAFHDATVSFERSGDVWQRPAHPPAEVICHNDFAPYNFVFVDGRLTGAIDVDMASPGSRAWDLSYLAYRLVPLTASTNPDGLASDLAERRRRLRLVCAAYARFGPVADAGPDAVLHEAPTRLLELADFSDARASVLPALAEHARLYRADAAWIAVNAPALA